MSGIHYFPRYSQKENMVTNNTLLLFSRLYHHKTNLFYDFINALLEKSDVSQLENMIQFKQQVKAKRSVPDGVIEHKSFKIIIETKLYGQENLNQIKRHCDVFNNEDRQFFILIDKEKISNQYRHKIRKYINEVNEERDKNISFVDTTFREICRAFEEILSPYDREMLELITDYEQFCLESKLIDNTHTKMRAVPVNITFKHNLKYNVYYMPSKRGYQNHRYIGLYKGKVIRAIGKITAIADIVYNKENDNFVEVNEQFGEITASFNPGRYP